MFSYVFQIQYLQNRSHYWTFEDHTFLVEGMICTKRDHLYGSTRGLRSSWLVDLSLKVEKKLNEIAIVKLASKK